MSAAAGRLIYAGDRTRLTMDENAGSASTSGGACSVPVRQPDVDGGLAAVIQGFVIRVPFYCGSLYAFLQWSHW
jgi:hypothetical protein